MRHRTWITLLFAAAALAAAPKPPTPGRDTPKPATPTIAFPAPAVAKAAPPKADVSRDVMAKGPSAAAVTEIPDSVPWGPGVEDVQPAACRLRAECRVDSDCALFCGKGAGQCEEGGCPILACECG